MADRFEKRIHTLTGESVFKPDFSTGKETSEPEESDDQKSDAASVWKDKYLHLLADLDNTKKRLARASSLEVECQNTDLLRNLLPVADGLDLVLTHISGENSCLNLFQGIKGVKDLLDKFLIKHEVIAFDVLGEVFDPNFHEALGMIQYPAALSNTVVRVERKGYLYRGKLLRPAQVLVAES